MKPQWWNQGTGCDQNKDLIVNSNPEHPDKHSSIHTEGTRHKNKMTASLKNFGLEQCIYTTIHQDTNTIELERSAPT